MPLRFALWITGLVLAALLALGQGPSYAADDASGAYPSDSFSYPLRAGESLSDVARIFRVPVDELIERNAIRDPSRLQLGQTLRVPNAFAREIGDLRAERDRLSAQKDEAERESAARQRGAAALETQLRQAEAERDAVSRELAATAHWQKAATMLAVLLVGALLWAVRSRLESTVMARKQEALSTENAALMVAKEKYRQAAAQLELRYQGLYGRRREPLAYAIAEGIERLQRAFTEGTLEIERLLGQIRTQREEQKVVLVSDVKARSWLPHPVRELIERYRLKYHTP
jgi:murein DD-endopeptidase MepM/ murein hydrolase activator NlpD